MKIKDGGQVNNGSPNTTPINQKNKKYDKMFDSRVKKI